jgi:predicted SAM-dependent methyltransferase
MIVHSLKKALYLVFTNSREVRKSQSGGLPEINNNLKIIYYFLFSKPMRASAWFYRTFQSPRSGVVKVHLGCGRTKYFPGWINLDANFISAKLDVWADLRGRLPFPDNSVDVFYSNHVIEHLPDTVLPFHFGEMYRCLKPGGIIRVGGPNGEAAARKFLENDINWFRPSKKPGIGARYSEYIMCGGEHVIILTFAYLRELTEAVGFVDVRQCPTLTETWHSDLIEPAIYAMESEPSPEMPHTLTIEAVKPPAKRAES